MSYLEHFELTEQPFRLTPDPDFLYWSKQHARAKAYMESTIWLADGFVVITGEIGSGKTTLLQSFLSELEDDVVYAVVSQTQLSPTEFLQAVLTEFGFKPFNKRKVELLDMLNMFLIEQYSNNKKVVLIIDEAQNLSKKVLEEVKEKVLRIILAGQPELKDTLESSSLKQLLQRVRLRFHIGPLDRREMREYIERRLSVAGRKTADLFTDDSFDIIYRFSGGIPRLINTLCDTSLLCAFVDEKGSVDALDVIAAAEELNWQEHESNTGVYEQLRQQGTTTTTATDSDVTRIDVRTDDETIDVLSFPLGRVIIGRSPDNEIYIKSKFVSRHHAQLVSDENTNGVFVGEKQVKKYRLRDGDVISLGVHALVYHDLRRHEARDNSETIAEDMTDDTESDSDEESSEDQDFSVNEA
jgi:type II secretory pathway predicted ATPase ExeA